MVRGNFGQGDGAAGEVRLRWKVALGLEDLKGLCAKFTLQMFRGRLLLNELGRELLARSARMMQLGARQARYFGRVKTQLQWFLATTVANLTLAIAGGAGKEAPETHQSIPNQLLQRLIDRLRTHHRRIRTRLHKTPTPAPVPIHANA